MYLVTTETAHDVPDGTKESESYLKTPTKLNPQKPTEQLSTLYRPRAV